MIKISSFITILTMMMIAILLIAPLPCKALVHGDIEILKSLAVQNKTNFESILTWSSDVFEERKSTRGDSYDYMLKNKSTFVYDKLLDAIRWNVEPQENLFIVDGRSLSDINAYYNSAMIKAQSSFEYSALGSSDNKKETYHLVIDELKRAGDWQISNLDPRYLLSDPGGGSTIYERLMFLYNSANDPNLHDWYIKREGNIVTLEVQFGEINDKTEKYLFDISTGGNLVKYYNKIPSAENTCEYTYEEKGKIWILKSYKMINITHRENGDLNTTRSINWSNSAINIPFIDDEFTIEKMGVMDGDYIHDHIIGMSYRYGGLKDSQIIEAANATNLFEDTNISSKSMVVEEANKANIADKNELINKNDIVKEKLLLKTSETNGKGSYINIAVVVFVIGLTVVVYLFTHSFRKEQDS